MTGLWGSFASISFGRILEDTNPAMIIPVGFGGGLHDRDVGWVRMGYRDYDPETARFTAKDPLGPLGGSSDLYDYCLDDPINLVDPEGLKSKEAGVDSAEEPPNLVVKKAGADSAQAQPQPNALDYKAIEQKRKNDKAATIWGLDNDVDKQQEVSKLIGPKLKDFEVYVEAPPGNATELIMGAWGAAEKKRKHYQTEAEKRPGWEKKAYKQKARDVSEVNEALKSYTNFFKDVVGSESNKPPYTESDFSMGGGWAQNL